MTKLTVNRVELIGCPGADPAFRNLARDRRCMNLSVATSERWKYSASHEWREKTEWHRVVVWNACAIEGLELAKGTRGDLVRIIGRLEARKWTHQGGAERFSTEIVLSGKDASAQVIRTRQSSAAKDVAAPSAGEA